MDKFSIIIVGRSLELLDQLIPEDPSLNPWIHYYLISY